jgi:luciferase-like monooxygenase
MEEKYANLRNILLGLPGVRLGSKFGEEAFFVGRRFFCHFHRGGTLLLETFVWDKVTEVVNTIPGVIPHPQYGAYGWVRLRIHSPADIDKAKKLIETSYRYVIATKRISLPKTRHAKRVVERAMKDFPNIRFKMKPSFKRIQIIMEVRNFKDSAETGRQLNQATNYLRKPWLGFPTYFQFGSPDDRTST